MGKPLGRKPDNESAVGRAARYYNDGLDRPMIAERMNVTPGTVDGYISRARYRGLLNAEKEKKMETKEAARVRDRSKENMGGGTAKALTDRELRDLHENILSAAPGTNVVYFENPIGWSKVPKNLKTLIQSMVNSGLIVHLSKRNEKGSFSLIAQRTKR
jgi:hypothetical protein